MILTDGDLTRLKETGQTFVFVRTRPSPDLCRLVDQIRSDCDTLGITPHVTIRTDDIGALPPYLLLDVLAV